ncbi:FHA domain-containing protein [Dactylosporangium sp. NPDC000521]|uniref:FHA domain-containing protein n=1 Tax=Dactylosporangium sp. NPDC000521 TaxID=3363975 RepID=UPI0036C15981
MAVCPKGHESETTDYCDECGAAMDPPPPAAVAPPQRPAVCPECGTPLTGRFCEVDGYDTLAVPSSPPAGSDALAAEAPAPGALASGPPVSDASLPEAPAPAGWHVVVSADRAHFDRVEAWNGADPTIAYPRFCPDRRFALTGDQVLIGRRSRSRGSYPDIDLAGPPEDVAVSHLHALLVSQPGGTWAVVDLRSANCTFVNGSDEPIQPEQPVPLADGDHIHVGSFTRITLHATPLP